jgi:DNA-binding CsgD family transcriptional regulator
MIQHPVQSDHLEALVETVRWICELPAVATQDWCSRAAECVSRLRPNTIACVTLGEIDAQGQLLRLEASGAHPDRPAREALEGRRGLGWSMDEPVGGAGVAALLRERVPFGTFADSKPGRRWANLGATDLMVAIAPVGDPASPRRLAVEIASTEGAPRFDRGELAILAAAIGELARRARLAFGREATDPALWITPREQRILEQLTYGKTVKQIAEDMARSPHTIHDHVKSLHRKLRVKSRGELIARTLGHVTADLEPSARHAAGVGSAVELARSA